MTFTSLNYLFFLGGVGLLYWLLPLKKQNILLLAVSYYFYAFVEIKLAIILAIYSVMTYLFGLLIERDRSHAKIYLLFSIFGAIGTLGYFKYSNFFISQVTKLISGYGLEINLATLYIIIPIGISFYAFQSLSYVIDVYNKKTNYRNNIIDVALFVSFFPQLLSGPIERSNKLLTQFENKRTYNIENITSGLALISWGFFQKLVIADNVGKICDSIFSADSPGFGLFWTGVLAFSVQIFADFSAYTDIARGSSRILGIELSKNFNNPWLSNSPTNFWKRWHITLSSWLRDYVYIPLGGNRKGTMIAIRNVIIVFLLGGIWHGASWNFVIWGFYHAVLVITETFVKQFQFVLRIPRILKVVLTTILFMFGWSFFRESDISYIVNNGFTGSPNTLFTLHLLVLIFIYTIPMFVFIIMIKKRHIVITRFNSYIMVILNTILGVICVTGILMLGTTTTNDFIYYIF